jgi:hypothetical protein
MKRFLILSAIAVALGGCTLDQFYATEQEALAVYAKVRAGAQVVSVELDAAVNATCLALPAINANIQAIIATIPNPGPKTSAAVAKGNAALRGAAVACDAYKTAPTLSGKVNVFLSLWTAYNAGKAAATAANTAGGA